MFGQGLRFIRTQSRQVGLEDGGPWTSVKFYHGLETKPRTCNRDQHPICLWPPGMGSNSRHSNGSDSRQWTKANRFFSGCQRWEPGCAVHEARVHAGPRARC